MQVISRRLFLSLAFLVAAQTAAANSTGSSTSTPATTTASSTISRDDLATPENPLSGFVMADYYGGFRTDSDPSAAYYANVAYKLKKGSVQVFQAWSHRLIKNQGEAEILNSDTALRYLSTSGEFIDSWRWQYRLEATLPTSQFSRDQDVITKPSVQLRFNNGILNDQVAISFRPFYREHINRFTTTVTEDGSGGGRPLIKSVFGLSLIASWAASERLSFDASADYHRVRYERNQFVNNEPSLGYSNFAQHRYIWDVGGNFYLIKDLWSVSAGYSVDSIVERLGGIEYLTYDDRISSWYLRTTYLF